MKKFTLIVLVAIIGIFLLEGCSLELKKKEPINSRYSTNLDSLKQKIEEYMNSANDADIIKWRQSKITPEDFEGMVKQYLALRFKGNVKIDTTLVDTHWGKAEVLRICTGYGKVFFFNRYFNQLPIKIIKQGEYVKEYEDVAPERVMFFSGFTSCKNANGLIDGCFNLKDL